VEIMVVNMVVNMGIARQCIALESFFDNYKASPMKRSSSKSLENQENEQSGSKLYMRAYRKFQEIGKTQPY